MSDAFFGRSGQIADLMALWHKRVPSLVTCRGRRRIGKSTLIEQFAKRSGARFIKIEGLRPYEKMKASDQELEREKAGMYPMHLSSLSNPEWLRQTRERIH